MSSLGEIAASAAKGEDAYADDPAAPPTTSSRNRRGAVSASVMTEEDVCGGDAQKSTCRGQSRDTEQS